ncbi:hypothetical protein D9619_002496 [Psilocybe cf. subviscida]|uniref:F-box domain-containing protein n=1 Tax=Psilocybe cf. subviscida TaxID=2480587 RepID=A0A8H5ETP8_9AGAR|nr:hypothetical protein D9619_002496 [Psilocybe cf. subviscida]
MLDASLAEADLELFSAITSHMSHIVVFNVWKAPSAFLHRFFQGLPAEMPALEEISINIHLLGEGGQENVPAFGHDNEQLLTLPDSVFRRAPNLRHLKLVKIAINWDLPRLSSLTTLVLFFSAPPTLSQLRSTLERMPNLEALTLQNSLPIPSSSEPPHQKPITLPNVKKLTVGGEPDRVECFFTHFSTPNVENVHSSFISQEGSYDLPFVLSTVKHPYSRPSPGPRSLMFFYHRLFIAQIAMAEAEHLTPALNLKIIAMENLSLPASSQEMDVLTTQLFDASNWSRLHDVSFARIFVSADVLARTFGSLPSIVKIYVGPESTLPLIEALQQGADVDPALDPTSVVFPGLREVSMHDVPFDSGYFSRPSDVDVDDLLDCLTSRHERGVGIHKLTLRKCHGLDEDSVELLEEVVAEVDWDHVVSEVDEEEEALREAIEEIFG